MREQPRQRDGGDPVRIGQAAAVDQMQTGNGNTLLAQDTSFRRESARIVRAAVQAAEHAQKLLREMIVGKDHHVVHELRERRRGVIPQRVGTMRNAREMHRARDGDPRVAQEAVQHHAGVVRDAVHRKIKRLAHHRRNRSVQPKDIGRAGRRNDNVVGVARCN